ncbi:MAG: ferritin-like domain-containing protein [Defluviicoccus sp.]|nr:ferritin-like domain-containing protein [Defluviicoccus sp.]
MAGWTLADIPWDEFDRDRVDPDIVPIVKAASLVEYNAEEYRVYLNGVFHDDPRMQIAVDGWAKEEIQHGLALGRWAKMADPEFDFEASFARFRDGFRLPAGLSDSVRGSRSGELVARCMVETGTNTYYSALAEATEEPVLKEICRRIAADEFAHYYLFYTHMTRYLDREALGFWSRLRVAVSRIGETEDDELAYAYYAANGGDRPYERRRNSGAYGKSALSYCTPGTLERSVEMVLQAVGIRTRRWISRPAGLLFWALLRLRMSMLARGAH